MKTNSITRKAMKTITLFFIAVLLSAQSFGMEQKCSCLLPAIHCQGITEEELKTEDWLTDYTTWSVEVSDNNESEEEMTAEKWMVDVKDKIWHTEIGEEEMQIEEWMYNLDSDTWNLNTNEEEIELENWMYDPSTWPVSK